MPDALSAFNAAANYAFGSPTGATSSTNQTQANSATKLTTDSGTTNQTNTDLGGILSGVGGGVLSGISSLF
jgi:hypothetical protein